MMAAQDRPLSIPSPRWMGFTDLGVAWQIGLPRLKLGVSCLGRLQKRQAGGCRPGLVPAFKLFMRVRYEGGPYRTALAAHFIPQLKLLAWHPTPPPLYENHSQQPC